MENELKFCEGCGVAIEGKEPFIIDGHFFCDEACAVSAGWKRCAECDDWAHPTIGESVEHDGELYCCKDCAKDAGVHFCKMCGDPVDEYDCVEYNGSYYCSEGCARDDDLHQCERCGTWFDSDDWDAVFTEDGAYCSVDCAVEDGLRCCDRCGEWFDANGNYAVILRDYAFCDADCAESEGYVRCDACGEWHEASDSVVRHGDYFCCESCADDQYPSEIHSYGYKPTPEFLDLGSDETKGDYADLLYMGVELEVDDGEYASELAVELEDANNYIYCKEDGSLGSEGVEIVTHPATLGFHTQKMGWDDICQTCLNNNYRSHDAANCGLHVHVNRTFFGGSSLEQNYNIYKVVLLMTRFYDSHVMPFSRRKVDCANRYAAKNDASASANESMVAIATKAQMLGAGDRFKCINLQNSNTIEFRIFRGTLKLSTLMATLQFVDTICRFAVKVQLPQIATVSWEDLFEGCQWKELNAYLAERTDYHPELVSNVIQLPLLRAEVPETISINDSVFTGTFRLVGETGLCVGDVVRVREWDELASEFGESRGRVNVPFGYYSEAATLLQGKVLRVKERLERDGVALYILAHANATDEAIRPYLFPGEVLEVFEQADAECA